MTTRIRYIFFLFSFVQVILSNFLLLLVLYQYLAEQLSLITSQREWLNDNWHRAKEIFDFLYGKFTDERLQIAIKHLEQMMTNPDYKLFVQEHEASGNTLLMWWEDTDWVNNHLRLGIDNRVVNAPAEGPNLAELLLIMSYPQQAFLISQNASIAEDETTSRYTKNIVNDKSDAFRHAYWLALNKKSVGIFFTILFANAHESSTPAKFQPEKEMDLYNNDKGISLDNVRPKPVTNAMLAIAAWNAVQNGRCVYLSPINNSDICFWGCAGNELGTHGITSQTYLIPTNQ